MAQLHVLIIEDSELDSALLLRTLRQSGYELVDKRVDTANPDALEQIRGINPTIPVIFTSGYSEESQLLSSLVSSGVAQLLQKPYPPKDLARKIRDILDKCGAKQSSALN
jgi:CheY-like chemotaxis protein